jgi:tetratricopeptide (TPR) repeat protein
MSWNAVVPYKGKPASPDGIRDLGVGYLVEGSVRQTGERMRLTAQLVDTRTGRVLWSARFDEALTNLFALQDRITREITGALAIRVTDAEARRTFAKPTENLEAYDYVLRARPALQRPERTSLVEARALLLRAIELDSSYAAARAALGETYYSAVSMGWAESPTASLDQAEELAHKALALDDSNVRARIILSRVHVFYQRYDQAKAEIDRALAINPNDASGIAGRGNILMWLGQTDAAIEDLELAQRIDPDLVPMDRFALSLAYYLKGRYNSAIEQAELNLRRSAGANFSRIVLAAAYAQQNRTADVERVVSIVRRADPTFEPQEFGTKFLSSGNLEHLREGLSKAGRGPPPRTELLLRQDRAALVRLRDVAGEVLLEQSGTCRRRLAENIELAVAHQPVLGIRHDDLAHGQGHCAEISELRRIARRIGLEAITVLGAGEPVNAAIPLVLDGCKTQRWLAVREIGDRVIALDRQFGRFRRHGCLDRERQRRGDGQKPHDGSSRNLLRTAHMQGIVHRKNLRV